MNKLIVADSNIPFLKSIFENIANLCLVDASSINKKTVRDADILIVRSVTRIGKELLDGSQVKFVGTVTSGYDHVDLNYLSSNGIKFFYAPGCNSNSVAEYVIAALLLLHRKYNIDLKEIYLGVVGVGNVGSKVVRKARALGVEVLQNDPPLQRKTGDSNFVHLDELMKCDVITLHVPLTFEGDDATYHFFNEKRMSAMKTGSILINTSRGSVVDTDALLKALNSHQLRTAILDVWENEPEINPDLLSMAAIGTPHIAGYSLEGKINSVLAIYKAVCEYLNVSPDWNPETELPPPEVSGIRIEKSDTAYVDIVADIVRKCYDIEKDNLKFRQVLQMSPEDGKKYFQNLRNCYHVRREFKATSIDVPKSSDTLARCLEGIGFTIKKHEDK